MENKTNHEKAKIRVRTRAINNGTWYLVLRPIPGGTRCGSKESTGLAPQGCWRRPLRSRKNATN